MALKQYLKTNWKLILNIVTLFALVGLVIAIHSQIAATINNLTKVNAWALLLMIPFEIWNYHAQTRLYQRLFGIVGNKLSYKYLFKTSLELNFVNHVFPSGGVTGISYFGMRLRRGDEITGGRATFIQIMKLAMTLLSFEVLIVFGILALAVVGKANNITILVAGSLSTLLLIGTAAFIFIAGSRQRISNFTKAMTQGLNKIIHIVIPNNPETVSIAKVEKVFDDFHESYAQLNANHQTLKAPFLYALLANITEVLVLYVVYIAFGHLVNIGAVILAYAIANFAGFISVLPGGIGIYEALMTAVLVSTGVPAAVSLPVTIMYRVLNTVIQLPPGYYLYHRNLARKTIEPEA
jgi:uncharacterized protein (TIRG00374 family)